MDIQRGQPQAEGRYLIFVQGVGASEWCEPKIGLWHKGKWHLPMSEPVYGWVGPLPVLRCRDFFTMSPVEEWAKPGEPLTWDEVFRDKERTEGGWRDRPAQEYDL